MLHDRCGGHNKLTLLIGHTIISYWAYNVPCIPVWCRFRFWVVEPWTCCPCHSWWSSSKSSMPLEVRSTPLSSLVLCNSWTIAYMPAISLFSMHCIAQTSAMFCLMECFRTCSLWKVSNRLFSLIGPSYLGISDCWWLLPKNHSHASSDRAFHMHHNIHQLTFGGHQLFLILFFLRYLVDLLLESLP
jgi:hypothetical protein